MVAMGPDQQATDHIYIMERSYQAVRYANTAIVVDAVVLFLIIACSIPAVRRIAQRFIATQKLRYQRPSERYEDEDGIATKESEAAYSYQVQRLLVLLLAVIGLLESLALFVVKTQTHNSALGVEQWLRFSAWVGLHLSGRTETFG